MVPPSSKTPEEKTGSFKAEEEPLSPSITEKNSSSATSNDAAAEALPEDSDHPMRRITHPDETNDAFVVHSSSNSSQAVGDHRLQQLVQTHSLQYQQSPRLEKATSPSQSP